MNVKWLGACMLVCMLSGCSNTSIQTTSLYDQLGRDAGIKDITDEFVYVMATHPQLEELFKLTDTEKLKEHFEHQFCELSGGPCSYSGQDMVKAHEGMDISHDEFNLVVELLQQSMRVYKVPVSAQNRLIALLAPMHADVVHR